MDLGQEHPLLLTRRQFFGRATTGIGTVALASLLNPKLFARTEASASPHGGLPDLPHFAAQARRVIYLFQSGAPSQMDLFDYKPKLQELHATELPPSVRGEQRLTGMTANQGTFPIVPSAFRFDRHGQCGAFVSELLPYTARIVDELAIVKTVHTEAINHDPAITFIQTGSEQQGRPSMGAWLSYGLGSENQNLPAFVVLVSGGGGPGDQPLAARFWGSGFLPSNLQGVRFRSSGDPVLYLSNPPGVTPAMVRRLLDRTRALNQMRYEELEDPEIATRISQYEMAYRMQTSVPELMDLSTEPASTFESYGPDSRRPGTFAANCLLARRLAERGVRFIQLYHRDWDHHADLPRQIRVRCRETDQPAAALVQDLSQRGLLDETLVIWGGEFGRTVYCQGTLRRDNYGRDHHPRCYTVWLTGPGLRRGSTVGETDDFSYNIASDPVHVHDLNATILHLLGIDHERLTYRFQGRDHRLTDVHGQVVGKLLA